MNVVVLRFGHRYVRDERTTTHVFLTARAFGATRVIYSGQRDEKVEEKVNSVTKIWGGAFQIEYQEDWKQTIIQWKQKGGEVIHLTVYGLSMLNVMSQIKHSDKDKMIIIGGAKIPGPVYEYADWNVSVTSQPHSEISALGVFLHDLFNGEEFTKIFENARLRVIPQPKGKKVLKM